LGSKQAVSSPTTVAKSKIWAVVAPSKEGKFLLNKKKDINMYPSYRFDSFLLGTPGRPGPTGGIAEFYSMALAHISLLKIFTVNIDSKKNTLPFNQIKGYLQK
jgi:hypothetical protein